MSKQENQVDIPQKMRQAIREEVTKAVRSALTDPDIGSSVRDSFINRVKKARQSDPGDDISLSQIKERLND